jgi:hypothetical protein
MVPEGGWKKFVHPANPGRPLACIITENHLEEGKAGEDAVSFLPSYTKFCQKKISRNKAQHILPSFFV